MKKVLLVTPFTPQPSGGAVILRSLLPYLSDVDLLWSYLGDKEYNHMKSIWLGKKLMGGYLLNDLVQSLILWNNLSSNRLAEILKSILAYKADVHWVVGHNEGIIIAGHLARLSDVPVHLSIHDDPPFGLFARTRRYRWLPVLAECRLNETIKSVFSLDVVSQGMSNYYQDKTGKQPVVVHRFIPELPKLAPKASDGSYLKVGHVGIVYCSRQLARFCQALREYGQRERINPKLLLVGRAKGIDHIVNAFPEIIQNLGSLSEEDAIEQLSQCDFMYAMQPFDENSTVFRLTSLPTKLTTYLQSQRPIFAHAPAYSTLAPIVQEYNLGIAVDSMSVSALVNAIHNIHQFCTLPSCFERARSELFGIENVHRLAQSLEQANKR